MLIREIILESDVRNEVVDDLMDLIMTYQQDGMPSIPIGGPSGVIEYLKNLGHDPSVEMIMDLVSQDTFSDVVERSTPEKISIKQSIPGEMISAEEKNDSQKTVDKMAAKAAKKAVKSGSKL